jgi:hypothetical protein
VTGDLPRARLTPTHDRQVVVPLGERASTLDQRALRPPGTRRRLLCCLLLATAVSGCASTHYARTTPGKLSGDLVVKWWAPDFFEFRPDHDRPLRFERGVGGDVIQPGVFYTDGGSIPKPFQALKNYSPWGYAPAFIIHDWLFHMQDCQLSGYERYTLESAAQIMSEVMKTMMLSPDFNFGDESTVYFMNLAVKSPPAASAWQDRKCIQVVPAAVSTEEPTAEFRISVP